MLKSKAIFLHGQGSWITFIMWIEKSYVEIWVRKHRIEEAKENYEKSQKQRMEWLQSLELRTDG